MDSHSDEMSTSPPEHDQQPPDSEMVEDSDYDSVYDAIEDDKKQAALNANNDQYSEYTPQERAHNGIGIFPKTLQRRQDNLAWIESRPFYWDPAGLNQAHASVLGGQSSNDAQPQNVSDFALTTEPFLKDLAQHSPEGNMQLESAYIRFQELLEEMRMDEQRFLQEQEALFRARSSPICAGLTSPSTNNDEVSADLGSSRHQEGRAEGEQEVCWHNPS